MKSIAENTAVPTLQEVDFGEPCWVHEEIAQRARQQGDALAVRWTDGALTFSELDARADALADRLTELGIGPESRVAIFIDRSGELVVAALAVLRTGAAYVPVDPSYPAERIAFMLADADVEAVVTVPALATGLPATEVPVLVLDAALLAREATSRRRAPTVHGEHLAYVVYTSGSTGKPKGVMVTHRGLWNMARWHRWYYEITPADRMTQVASPGFDALAWELWPYLSAGASIHQPADATRLSPQKLLGFLIGEGITQSFMPTPLAEALLRETWPRDVRLRSLQAAGEALKSRPPADLPMRLVNNYGPSENSVVATCGVVSSTGERPPSIGVPVANVAGWVVDRGLEEMPVETAGELCLGGAQLARGYLKRPGLTAERFVPEALSGERGARLYRTGDRVRWLAGGRLEFLGRIDHQVKIRGFRIELGEIEALLTAHPAVETAAVLVREDAVREGAGEKRLVAYAVPSGPRPDVARLQDDLGKKLPAYMVPEIFVFMDALPVDPNGKVDRRALPAPEEAQQGDYKAPRTDVEKRLAELWQDLLGLDRAAGIDDDFLELGGHSLLIGRLVDRIRNAFEVDLGLREIYEEPTIAGLAERITVLRGEGSPDDADEPLLQLVPPPIEAMPRDPDELLPLSFPQERIWFLYQLAPDNIAYNAQATIHWRGSLSVAALEQTIQEIICRHEVFRTSFPEVDGRPVQRIHEAPRITLPVVDLETLDEATRQREIERLTVRVFAGPFSLLEIPLARWVLLRLGVDDHMMLQAEHHFVHDGWSFAVLIGELKTLYEAFAAGRPSPLGPPSLQFADYARWQRRWMRGEVLEQYLKVWTARLEGADDHLDLPTDHPRPKQHAFRGRATRIHLDPVLCRRLRALSRQRGVTLFTTMLSAYKAVLHHYSGSRDLVVSTTRANRDQAPLVGMLGMVVNTLILRTDLHGPLSFDELVKRVHETCLGAFAWPEMPLDKLVEALDPERDLARNPLFQTMFSFHDSPVPDLELPGVTGKLKIHHNGSAKLDLSVVCIPLAEQRVGRQPKAGDEGIEMIWEQSVDLFDKTTIERLIGHYRRLLEAVAEDPAQRIAELDLLDRGERHQLVHEWGQADRRVDAPASLHGFFAAQATAAPQTIAVSCEDEQLSYGELARRARQLARHLRERGQGPEARVGILLERSAEQVLAALGILEAGAAYLPIDPAYPAERARYMLDDAGAELVLTSSALKASSPPNPLSMAGEGEQEILPPPSPAMERGVGGVRTPAGRKLASSCHRLCLDQLTWEELPDGNDFPEPSPSHLAYVIYTSGSTGRPKGTLITHGNATRLLRACERDYDFGTEDVWTLFHSLAFDFSVWELWGALAYGGRLSVVPYWVSRSPEGFRELVAAERVTVLNQTPSAFRQLIHADEERSDALALRYVIFGGEALQLEALAPWMKRHGDQRPLLVNMYGITETTVHVTVRPLSLADLDTPWRSPIGRPLADLELQVLDPRGLPTPIGVGGELHVGGAGLCRGYLGRPALTAERFVPRAGSEALGARLYRSGDLARFLRSGELDYLGRIDQQVKIRGFRIELGEIEAALTAHPAVRESVVLLLESAALGHRLVAFLVPADGATAKRDEAREALRRRLPEYMVPSAWIWLDDLPLTTSGKVDRRALTRLAEGRDLASGELDGVESDHVAPRGPVEETVAAIWSDLLGVDEIGAGTSFFALGGHSLLAAQSISRLRSSLGVELSLVTFFDAPTVAGLAAACEEALRGEAVAPLPELLPIERGDVLAPSFAQERLWFLDQLLPRKEVYNVPRSLRLLGRLDPAKLAWSLGEIRQRHEVLRAHFQELGGRPWQIIDAATELPLPLIDLSRLAAPREAAEKLRLEEAHRPFDLAHGPLVRATLLRLAAEEHILILSLHHCITDGWSMGVLMRDLAAFYEAAVAGRPAALPELAIQYADYAAWQRHWLRGERLAAEIAYWRERGIGDATLIELPTDRPRPPAMSYRGARVMTLLSEEHLAELEALARRQQATPFMVLLAAFHGLLSRYSGQREISVGSPVAGRRRLELEDLIGAFVNVLVLRQAVDPAMPFADLLRATRRSLLAGVAHQDVPFEKLVEELHPERSLSHAPLFQVTFALQNTPPPPSRLGELELETLPIVKEAAMFDLSLDGERLADGLRLLVVYSRDLFDRATIERFLGHYQRLLAAAASDPGRAVGELELLSDGEKQQLIGDWGTADRRVETPATLHGLFAAHAATAPQAIAVSCEDEQWSYGALSRRARQLARRLLRLGQGPEARIGILLERSAEQVLAVLGILEAGAAYLPIDPAYPAERARYMLDDAGAELVLTSSALESGLSSPPNPLSMAGEGEQEFLCLDQLTWEEDADGEDFPELSPSHLAYVIYTSGSTGRPKGTLITHGNATRLLRACERDYDFDARDVWTLFHSLAFDFSVWELWGALAYGGRLSVVPYWVSRSPEAFRDLLASERVTVLNQTPSAFRQLIRADEERDNALALRYVIFGGEALQLEALTPWLTRHGDERPRLVNMYGITETTVHVTVRALALADLDTPWRSPIGRPLADLEARVLDPRGLATPIGVGGELHIGGAGLCRGYLGRGALTAERFVPKPASEEPGARLYRTGDLARFLPSGELDYLGRIDHQVKIRGFRIELGEIEAALTAHPAVRESVVLLRDDDALGQRLIAYLVPATAVPATESAASGRDEVREELRRRLPEYMLPSAWVWLDALPLTTSGKVDRRALPAPVETASAGVAASPLEEMARQRPVDELLATIWGELLGRADIRPQDDFFDLGGHSLLATQLISRLRTAFRIDLPLSVLFEHPTLSELASEVTTALKSTRAVHLPPPIEPVPRQDLLPLSFAQERLWFLHQLAPGSAAYNIAQAFRLRGPLDVPVLAASLDALRRRHEVLRTTFEVSSSGEPYQRIRPFTPCSLPVVDLGVLSGDGRQQQLERLTRQDRRRPFALDRDPMLRAALLRVDRDEHVLLLTLHHAAADGWSFELLRGELALLYRDRDAAVLPELPLQVADFAVWQRRWLSGEVLDAELAFWHQQLADLPPLLELPWDRPRPAALSDHGAVHRQSLPAELEGALRTFARSASATPFMVLLAVFAAELSRLSGRRRLAIGTPIAGRHHLASERLIGCFLNDLALRVDVDPRGSFADLVAATAHRVLLAQAHQDLPFEKLVDAVQPTRTLAFHPLFQVMLNLHNFARGEEALLELAGLAVERLSSDELPAKLDLNVHVIQRPGGELEMAWIYSTDLFDATTVARFARGFTNLAVACLASPEQMIAELPVLDRAERQQILIEWNDTQRSEEPRLLHELFTVRSALAADAVALVHARAALTYGQLDRRSESLARRLRRRGVTAETRVGIHFERSFDMVIAVLAVLRAGGAYVPLDPHLPAARLVYMLEQSHTALLLTHQGDAAWSGFSGDVLDPRELPETAAGPAVEPRLSPDHLAYVVYTSGTTGRPKGVMGHHRGAVSFITCLLRLVELRPGDRTLQLASLAFDASVREIFAPLAIGGTLVLPTFEERRDPLLLLRLTAEERLHALLSMVPSFLRTLLEAPREELSFAGLRSLLSSGERLFRDDCRHSWQRFGEQLELINLYGSTEGTMTSFAHRLRAAGRPEPDQVRLGRPMDDRRFYVVDPRLVPVPIGVRGELFLAGSGLTRGYLDNPRETAAKLVPDPFGADGGRLYATGDLVRTLPDGVLELVGRRDHQLKVLGNRVELGEIEATLRRHPGVVEAAVLAMPGHENQPRLTACIEALPETRPTPQELRTHLAETLPDYMLPAAWAFLDELPLNTNGKIDRQALEQLVPSAVERRANDAFSAPRSQVEKLLAAIWSELLQLDQVGRDDSFFALGGNSLDGIRSLFRLRELLGVELAARVLFDAQTLADMAILVEEKLCDQLAALDADAAKQALDGLGLSTPTDQDDEDLAALPPKIAERARGLSSIHLELRARRLALAFERSAEEPIPRYGKTVAPLSFFQETFWLIEQLEGSAVYNSHNVLNLQGPLDIGALGRAFDAMVERHEILRSCIELDDDGLPFQKIFPRLRIAQPVVDLRRLRDGDRRDESTRWSTAVSKLRFTLDRAPLLGLLLLRLADEETSLLVVMHHMITDDWSLGGIFFRELAELYNAARASRTPDLPELPIQFADYALWERQRLDDATTTALLDYWSERLAGGLPQLALRSDRPRPQHPRYRGAVAAFELGDALSSALEERGRKEAASPFMLLLAAYKILLAERSGQDDILVASPVANRSRRQTEHLLGCLINMLVLRTDLSHDPTLREVVGRVKETVLGAFSHQELPFMLLLANFPPPDFAFDRSPFQASFTFLNAPRIPPRFTDLELASWGGLGRTRTDQDLSLWMTGREQVRGMLVYDSDLFDASTIEEMISQLRTILEKICLHPEERLSAVLAALDAGSPRRGSQPSTQGKTEP